LTEQKLRLAVYKMQCGHSFHAGSVAGSEYQLRWPWFKIQAGLWSWCKWPIIPVITQRITGPASFH